MAGNGNDLDIHELKTRILQMINDMSDIDRKRLPSILFADQSDYENKKLLSMIVAVLPESDLRKLWKQLENWHIFKLREMRKHPRRPSFISVESADGDISFTDFIQDISNGGVYIRTGGSFFVGQQVSLTFSLPKVKQDTTVNGEVARVDDTGVGVKFKEPLNIA